MCQQPHRLFDVIKPGFAELRYINGCGHMISIALARTIGWGELTAPSHAPNVRILNASKVQVWFEGAWRDFDFMDPSVTDAIADRLGVTLVQKNENGTITWMAQLGAHTQTRYKTSSADFGKMPKASAKARLVAIAMCTIQAGGLPTAGNPIQSIRKKA
jgi:hypothetical protein